MSLTTPVVYVLAAIAEIAGCFAFWAWLRHDKSALWLIPGMACLAAFAWLLTLVDSSAAGRAYAAYGGLCRLWRGLHRRVARLALGGGRLPSGPLGHGWRRHLHRRRRRDPGRPAVTFDRLKAGSSELV